MVYLAHNFREFSSWLAGTKTEMAWQKACGTGKASQLTAVRKQRGRDRDALYKDTPPVR